ncbi:MAG: pilus assembly protein TadG-related protein [Microthrixaceae bacterium]
MERNLDGGVSVTRSDRMSGDGGIAIVLVALLLVTLMVVTSMVVDVGATYNLRRQDQSAADVAALAAAREIGGAPATLAVQAKKYANDTLGVALTDGEWNSCAALSGWTAVAGASCVTYRGQSVHVRIPVQQYKTTFGRVVGRNTIEHSAFAIAGLKPAGFGGVLPFAVTGTAATGGFGCLKTASNGTASPWCGSTSGNYGFLDFGQFGNTDLNTSTSCGSGGYNARVRDNIAMGADHEVSLFGSAPHGVVSVLDIPACGSTPQTDRPNGTDTQTGNNSNDVSDGMFYQAAAFSDGGSARLSRSAPQLFDGDGETVQVHDRTGLDDNPLWQFIPPDYGPGESTSADIPSSCKRDQFVDSSDNYTTANLPVAIQAFVALANERDRVLGLLARCFAHYQGQAWNGFPLGSLTPSESATGCSPPTCDDPVFARDDTPSEQPNLFDIQYTPRFAYVPVIASFPPGSSNPVNFLRFRPTFIQRLVITKSGADTIWDPGVSPAAPTSGSYQTVTEVSVFTFPDGMLPNDLTDPEAPYQVNKNKFISLIR